MHEDARFFDGNTENKEAKGSSKNSHIPSIQRNITKSVCNIAFDIPKDV